ncbi:complement decay-accelerating factor, GPI-anchored-like isoform X3 [Erythrolamprus reginae]|uniref:complement decay-accelerating factor, GPI-anchored-like isoform X3 n=1 Tax=Erythrolamprus reginae TaxID=121349 RepID=UPI00396C4100
MPERPLMALGRTPQLMGGAVGSRHRQITPGLSFAGKPLLKPTCPPRDFRDQSLSPVPYAVLRPYSWRLEYSFFERKNKMSRSPPVMFRNFFPHLRPRILVLFSLFSGVQGDCGPPPVLKYTYTFDPIKSVYKPREAVVYTCLPGYRQDNSKPFIAYCSSDKGWNTLEEFCELVPYVCHRSAYVIPGHPERTASTCFSNYTWSSVPVFCKGQSCGDPGTPDNGDRIIPMDFLLKAKVNFMCNEGYELIGSPTIQCLSRSFSNNTVVWKPKPPICFRPTCPPPPEIKNGNYTRGKNGTFPLNSNVTYICDLGFSLSGDDLLHCITEDNKTGIWRESVPECKAPTTSKPTKYPTPAVPSTPPIPPRPGTPKEDITVATVPPVTTETVLKDVPESSKAIGIAVGAVISIIVLAALIFAAVKWSHRKGKANTYPGSTDNYHVVAEKDVALQEKLKD